MPGPRPEGTRATGGPPERHVVQIVSPHDLQFAPPVLQHTAHNAERINAIVVIALTLACTVLAIFDLLLLASGYA